MKNDATHAGSYVIFLFVSQITQPIQGRIYPIVRFSIKLTSVRRINLMIDNMLIEKCINEHLYIIDTQMQNPCIAAKKSLNLHLRFATALADTPCKNDCCT